MRKTIIAVVACIMSIASSWAQREVNTVSTYFRAGMTYPSIDKTNDRIGYMAGLEFKYQMTKHQAISLGGSYNAYRGEETYYIDRNISLDYISVPLLYNYYVAKGLSVKAGIEANFSVNDKAESNNDHVGAWGHSMSYEKYLRFVADDANSVEFHKFRMAIPIGVSYEYRRFCIDARFEIGLTSVVQYDNVKRNMNAFTLTAGMKL